MLRVRQSVSNTLSIRQTSTVSRVTYKFIDISVGTETYIRPHSGKLHNNIRSAVNEHHHKHLPYLQIIRHRKILGNISHLSSTPPKKIQQLCNKLEKQINVQACLVLCPGYIPEKRYTNQKHQDEHKIPI